MFKMYLDFEEVAAEIEDITPPVIYKYRDWKDAFHKKVITHREVLFAHPHSLNDPYDVRPPYNFIADNINWDEARAKIKSAGRYFEPHLTVQELDHEVDIRLKQMQADPVAYFMQNRGEYILEKESYDPIGVFSCCMTFENEPMWAHYGNNHCGFAVGFRTVELSRALQCTVGYVNYNDAPVDYHIMGDNAGIMENELFQKSKKWEVEQELRFITSGIGLYRQRPARFPVQAVTEIVFGLNTSLEAQAEIIAAAAESLPGVPFYQVKTRTDGYGFEKVQL